MELLENGVTMAASLASWCVRSGVDVGFMANGENQLNEGVTVYVEPRCSEAHLDRSIAVIFHGLDLRDHHGAGQEHRYRCQNAVLVENLCHSDFCS